MKDKKQEEAKVEAAETPADNEEVKAEATADNAAADAGAEAGAGGEKPAEPDWKTLYAITLADFDNYKKRAAHDREDFLRYAESEVLKAFLPVMDNLALALGSAPDKDDAFVKGVQLVYDKFLSAFKERGAEPFDSVGLELDVEKMEAIAQLPSETVEEGKVSNEAKRGWMLKGKVLRAAQVVVSAGKGA
jgi:molecular chaperone GrpE